MKKEMLDMIIDIYEMFDSTCIINTDKLSVDCPDGQFTYTSRTKLAYDLLYNIRENVRNIEL